MCDVRISKNDWEKYFVKDNKLCFLSTDNITKDGICIKYAKYKRSKYDVNHDELRLYNDRFKHGISYSTSKNVWVNARVDVKVLTIIREFIKIGWFTKASCCGHLSNKTDFYDEDCKIDFNESMSHFKHRSYLGSVLSEPDVDDIAYFYVEFTSPHPEMREWPFVINNNDYKVFHKHKKLNQRELEAFCCDKAIEGEIYCCLNEDCTKIMAWCPKKRSVIYKFHSKIRIEIVEQINLIKKKMGIK